VSTRQDYITAIGNLVGGESHPLGETEKIAAIGMAVKEHSRHSPLTVVEDETGDGGFDYAVVGLASWADGFSVVKQVEYPVDDDDETPDILQEDAWMMYETPAGMHLRFLEDKPPATESFRVTYTAIHACTDAACTVKAFDDEAVQALAAAFFCEMLATYYAQMGDSTIAADSVDHTSKSREYAARAKTWRGVYFSHLGVKEGSVKPASVTQDWDLHGSWQADKLTHPQKYR
jgi:hypothetical protein